MLRGLYTAASGMFSLERRQETLANNLANAQTPGFKKDDTVLRAFPKLLMQRINDFNEMAKVSGPGVPPIPGYPVPIGDLYNGVYAQERIPSFTQGALVDTNNPLDIAIEDQEIPAQNVNGRQVKPNAFFAVQLPNGTVGYTRDGKFDLDTNGNLVTADGYRVIGSDNKPVQINSSISKEDLQISPNGQIIAYPNEPSKTRNIGRIGISIAQNPLDLRRLGGNVYQSTKPLQMNQGNGANSGVTLHQGTIEQSNVDLGQTMTDMMSTVRGYEANQKVLGVYDQSLDKLYTVGRLDG
ncbi:flagellar hook-basal body protein [Neobacillus cucumis]|nr:flagellar hook-basal body protein [Neobacillus cucumis]